MIDEAIGKILGMAMAYGASALGMLAAYVNYRKRIVRAEKLMTPTAWGVIVAIVLATAGGVVLVWQLAAERPAAAPTVVELPAPEPVEVVAPEPDAPERPARRSWSWLGILVPAAIFLFATIVTTGLHRHFTAHGHS